MEAIHYYKFHLEIIKFKRINWLKLPVDEIISNEFIYNY